MSEAGYSLTIGRIEETEEGQQGDNGKAWAERIAERSGYMKYLGSQAGLESSDSRSVGTIERVSCGQTGKKRE